MNFLELTKFFAQFFYNYTAKHPNFRIMSTMKSDKIKKTFQINNNP